jgi:hypothetical protein
MTYFRHTNSSSHPAGQPAAGMFGWMCKDRMNMNGNNVEYTVTSTICDAWQTEICPGEIATTLKGEQYTGTQGCLPYAHLFCAE